MEFNQVIEVWRLRIPPVGTYYYPPGSVTEISKRGIMLFKYTNNEI